MKSRRWLATAGLIILALAAVVASVLTADSGSQQSVAVAQKSAAQSELVDESPLQIAREAAKLASGPDEERAADQALELSDSEVDLAFHDALRDAASHPPQAKAEFRPLYQHANEAATQVSADQSAVDSLKKQLSSAKASLQASTQEKLDVAQAQLELDQDELNDAKEDLIRAGADPGSLIQRQFDEHQAAEHGGSDKPVEGASNNPAANIGNSLIDRFKAWRAFGDTTSQLQSARNEAVQLATALTKAHNDLDKRVAAERAKTANAGPPATASPSPGQPAATSQPTSAAQNTIATLHTLSADKKNLADMDQRIQDAQDLQKAYDGWIALVHVRQRSVLHSMIQSLLWILLIVLAVYLVDRVIDHYLADLDQERTRLRTLRVVIHFAVQAVGAMLILLVIFGAPQQTPTILGFAGAGLTVALKDFIVAFVGWFVLMGKNGIRVGDWVEINGVAGQVIEINLLRTVLLETGNWTTTGHPTGRKVAFVNSYAIEGHFFNFTTSGQWLWDEIELTVPSDKDPYALIDAIQKTVTKETEANARAAEEEWKGITNRYRVRAVSATPAVNLRPTGTGIEVHVRYITRALDRYALRARLNQALVQLMRSKGSEERESVPART